MASLIIVSAPLAHTTPNKSGLVARRWVLKPLICASTPCPRPKRAVIISVRASRMQKITRSKPKARNMVSKIMRNISVSLESSTIASVMS